MQFVVIAAEYGVEHAGINIVALCETADEAWAELDIIIGTDKFRIIDNHKVVEHDDGITIMYQVLPIV